jgi:acetyl-CoA synthetase
MILDRLLRPASIAVVGATERPGSYGGEALLNLERVGYRGRVYAVNPSRSSVHGRDCHPSLDALPEAPDAVVVAIPAAAAPRVVEQAGALGCGGAVVFAAGFAEAASSAALQDELAAAARRHALPVCGPNGNGIVSLADRVALWGDAVTPRPAGPVALVSQSGNVAVNALASARGLRLHTVVSSGNEAVLSSTDYLGALAAADGVRAVALYVEDEGDGVAWALALEACARRGIGVAVLKAGTSEAGAAAARAHTGAVAGDATVFRALVEEAGGAWATTPHELLELAKALAAGRGRRRARPGAGGIAVMTCSGGDSSVAADLAADLGVGLAALSPGTLERLDALLPEAAAAANPLDYTALLWDDGETLSELVVALGADPAVERVLVFYDEPLDLPEDAAASWAAVLGAVRAGAERCPAPVAVASTLPELLPDASAAALAEDGIPAIAGLRTGLVVAAALGAPPGDPGRIAVVAAAARRARDAAARSGGPGAWLAEHEAKALLRGAGIPVPDGRVAAGADDAVAAAADLGGPVALKLSAAHLQHKSDAGALALGLTAPGDIRAAAGRLLALDGEAALLVERMAEPGAELLVAARTDAAVPALVVGAGGVWTEVLGDAAVVPLPADPGRVERALRGLRAAPLLTGARGRTPADLSAVAALAARAGDLLLDRGLELLELNPVIAGPHGAVAVDAVARTTGGTP